MEILLNQAEILSKNRHIDDSRKPSAKSCVILRLVFGDEGQKRTVAEDLGREEPEADAALSDPSAAVRRGGCIPSSDYQSADAEDRDHSAVKA